MKIDQFYNYSGISIIEEHAAHTYGELTDQISRYKKELVNTIASNEVVAILSDYSFESISALLALSEFPCIIVPIVPTTDAELQNKLSAAKVTRIITFKDGNLIVTKAEAKDIEKVDNYQSIIGKNHSGLVLFSSGTTGVPKVMVHDFSDLISDFKEPKKQKDLNFILFLLFDHIGGINTLLGCLNNGSQVTIPENRNPEHIMQIIQDKKIQILPTSPTFLNLMLMTEDFEKYDLSSLKMITYGTERMPQHLLNKLKEKIPRVKFMQTFGTSETGILKTESKSSTSLFFKIIDPDYKFKIEDGQLFLHSKNQVSGYVNQKSDQFTKEGWFATGDLVEEDEDGYIKIIGRINKVINVGGLKVLPKEVEDIIDQIEGVIDSTVYAKDNAITGQMVCAKIVIEEGIDEKEMKQIILKKCKEELDRYKVPGKIIISHSLSFTNRFKKEI
ncbi:Acyl-CoA synthetase (AMP-forming)/AMP-acid ligase II [Chryseobacterium sp. RU37D]|uniref:ANL family adenylate-forming protein n=1 Tax=Chryseobacterium sp. RU37D TaxID=1907397 RepID=UPI000954EDA7|nr:fatty acid--CoA ligase family protein [Chryseobacterium sp. RU37D]SIQ05006.1 Acyl-CoA synthetase (AMP-forming)/AMP-acid ligase II [Chryseobacterium sp. RU37D]